VNLGVLILREEQQECITDVQEQELDYRKLQELPGIVGYIVQPGDTLWEIARTYYTTPEKIRRMNGMEREEVQPGDRLLVVKELMVTV